MKTVEYANQGTSTVLRNEIVPSVVVMIVLCP